MSAFGRIFDNSEVQIYVKTSAPLRGALHDMTPPEIDAKLVASEAKVDARLANFDSSVKTGFADLRADLAKLRSEMHKNTTDLIKWGVLTALGFATVTIAILTVVINNSKAPSTAPVVSPPIIINVPASAPGLAPPATQTK